MDFANPSVMSYGICSGLTSLPQQSLCAAWASITGPGMGVLAAACGATVRRTNNDVALMTCRYLRHTHLLWPSVAVIVHCCAHILIQTINALNLHPIQMPNTVLSAAPGVACNCGYQCTSSVCGRQQAGSDSTTCCSNITVRYAGLDYCSDMVAGTTCWLDSMCASGYCKGNAGGTRKGASRGLSHLLCALFSCT